MNDCIRPEQPTRPIDRDKLRNQILTNLSEIVRLAVQLEREAIDKGASKALPGGRAMAALSPVAQLARFAEWWATREPRKFDDEISATPETPLQRLCFWTEYIRVTYSLERDQRPGARTYETETQLIRWKIDALTRDLNDEHVQGLGSDVHHARSSLENTLKAGSRDLLSEDVDCFACGTRLRKRMTDTGIEDDWWCSQCSVVYDPPRFNLAAMHAARRALGVQDAS